MSREQNLATQQRERDAINSGDLDRLDDVFAATVVDHDPAPDQEAGPAGYKRFYAGMRAAFPDLTVTPVHMVCTDDEIAIAYTISGSHQGPFMGIPPTGRHVQVRGMQIARFADGMIVERWGSSDELGILQQIGAMSQPASGQPDADTLTTDVMGQG